MDARQNESVAQAKGQAKQVALAAPSPLCVMRREM